MQTSLDKPGTPEELVHFGVKGMRWGVRNETDSSSGGTGTTGAAKTGMSTKKKVAIGAAVAVGTVATAYALHRYGENRKSEILGYKFRANMLTGKKTTETLFNEKMHNVKLLQYRAQLDSTGKSKKIVDDILNKPHLTKADFDKAYKDLAKIRESSKLDELIKSGTARAVDFATFHKTFGERHPSDPMLGKKVQDAFLNAVKPELRPKK